MKDQDHPVAEMAAAMPVAAAGDASDAKDATDATDAGGETLRGPRQFPAVDADAIREAFER